MTLPLTIIKEGKMFVAYTPALDLSTAGKTEKDARRMFREVVAIFMEEIIKAGTVEDVLTGLGWKKEQEKWNPPQLVSSDFIEVNIPAFA